MSQERMNMSFGIDFPELINIGMLYQLNQIQVGVSFGGMYYNIDLIGNYFATSITGKFYYHFAGLSEISNRRLWFIRTGLTYFSASSTDKHLLLDFRLGRDIYNESKRLGLSLSLGLVTRLYYLNTSEVNDVETTRYLFPSAGLNLFYRFGFRKE